VESENRFFRAECRVQLSHPRASFCCYFASSGFPVVLHRRDPTVRAHQSDLSRPGLFQHLANSITANNDNQKIERITLPLPKFEQRSQRGRLTYCRLGGHARIEWYSRDQLGFPAAISPTQVSVPGYCRGPKGRNRSPVALPASAKAAKRCVTAQV
jgi:hypothetical protein